MNAKFSQKLLSSRTRWWYGSGYLCILSTRQQCEQTVVGVGVVFKYPLGSVQASHFTDITDAL